MKFRLIQPSDYDKRYFDLLKQLTVVEPSKINKSLFNDQLKIISQNGIEIYVIEDNSTIIASGSLLIEPKIIHGLGLVGHIEDIVVDKKQRGKGLGGKIIKFLVNLSKTKGCYKVILNCSNENIKFYEKNGFTKCENEMTIKF
jgi:glucosamine-phosphate N-acetyltransferase